jgi:hypothetical protein
MTLSSLQEKTKSSFVMIREENTVLFVCLRYIHLFAGIYVCEIPSIVPAQIPYMCSRTRLKRKRFMRQLSYNVGYSVVPVNSSLLSITIYSSLIRTVLYNDTKSRIRDFIAEVDSTPVFH